MYAYYLHCVRDLSYQSYGSRKEITCKCTYTREREISLYWLETIRRTQSGAAVPVHELASSRRNCQSFHNISDTSIYKLLLILNRCVEAKKKNERKIEEKNRKDNVREIVEVSSKD